MLFTSLENIKQQGFLGFVKISELQTNASYKQIPAEQGIYLIVRLSELEPEFLELNPSRMHNKHRKNPARHTYDVQKLKAKLAKVKNSIVIYIGKAGGGQTHTATLYQRLRAYIEAGLSREGSSTHSGGRAIWQLKDSSDLLVCWKPATEEDAIKIERDLLHEFKAHYGSLPLANWRT